MALGMGVGAFAAGLVVDVQRAAGMWPAFLAATAGFGISAAFLALATRASAVAGIDASSAGEVSTSDADGWRTYRHLLSNRSVRLLALVSIALAAGFYAQFETGLPAFALQSLSVEPTVVGHRRGGQLRRHRRTAVAHREAHG